MINKLIDENEIQNRILELANEIQNEFKNEEIIVLCILKGSVFFTVDLVKRISNPIILEFLKVSSYSGTKSTGNITLDLDIKQNIENKNVIIIEDILDTGRTLSFLKEYILSKNPKKLKICTLLDKKERREFDIKADYVGFDIPDKFVIGYGLDYDEKYRNLPYIGCIEQ